jgi:hypothetical protein
MIPLEKAALRLFPARHLQEKYSSQMNTLWNHAILLPATRFLLQNESDIAFIKVIENDFLQQNHI